MSIESGLHHDLDEATYHADPDSLSVTGAKLIMQAPALFKHRRDNPEHRDVFDFGSAAHRQVLGVGPELAIIPATSRAKADQEAHKAAKEAAYAAGHIPITEEQHATIRAMADKLSEHRLAMQLLSDGTPEVSAFCHDEETGVMRRARFDWLGARVLSDYKSCVSADPLALCGRYGVVKKFGYDQQAEWYLRMARDLGHPAAAFAFIFQAKTPPYLVTVAYVPDHDLEDAREANRAALQRFRDCTESGIWPGYIPDDSCVALSLTNHAYTEENIA